MSNVTQSEAQSASSATLETALVFNGAVFAIEIIAFTLLRPRFKAIYEPRTYVPPPSKRVESISSSLFAWPLAIYRADYNDIAKVNGLDAYFFVRYLRVMTILFFPIWILTWAVLIPITSVKTGVSGHAGLDKFSLGNVAPDDNPRYSAHVVIAYILTAWICYYMKQEMSYFVKRRQDYLVDPAHAKTIQAKTVLVTGIPKDHLSEQDITGTFSALPGGVKKIWINRDLKELPSVYDRRLAACNKLESAETTLLRTAAKISRKANKDGSAAPTDPERDVSLAEQLVPRDKRPTHRLPLKFMPFSLPLIGQKVDTIDWAREQIRVCGELLENGRKAIDSQGGSNADQDKGVSTYPERNSAFVTFNNQLAAHMALKVLAHHEPYAMSGKWGETSPQDVIWGNLGMNPYEQKVRTVISYTLTAVLIIFWAIPVAFVGIVSNVHALCKKVVFLAWICKLPKPVVGIISGILPAVLLAILFMLLPIILRVFAKFQGIPKKSGVELSLMTRFFIFVVIHGFLIVTLSAGIIQALPGILNSPTQTPALLAQNLPLASTFFLTYVILQGLSGTGGGFLQIVTLIVYYVKLFLLGSTPRSIYNIKYGVRTVEWGTLFPGVTLIVVIGLGYSIISPIMNGFACAAFFGFYALYKHAFLWQLDSPSYSDTGGLFYPKALQHVFVGVYINQICLFALFLLSRNPVTKKQIAIPEAIIMFILILLTAFYHHLLNDSYDPLIHPLPLTLADKTSNEPEAASEKEISSKQDEKGGVKRMLSDDEYGFAHPALTRPQRVVWIPRDTLGLAKAEEQACVTAGVEASFQDAEMNEKGEVDIQGPPPDEPENE